jgi:hypothetical protein
MKLRSRLLAIISALIGLALFFSVLKQTGLGEIGRNVRSLGWGFLLILAISATRYLSRSLAWRQCMTPAERRVGFWTLWRARLAGEAIGDLTFGPVVAEPLRLVALGDKLSLSAGVSSLAVENISYTVSSCVMVLAGAAALLASFALEESLRAALLAALALVGVIIVTALVIISRRWALGSSVAGWLNQLLIRDAARRDWLTGKIAQLRLLENYVFDFYAKRPGDFLLLVLCHAAFHLAGVLEIFVTLRLLGVALSFATAFMLEAINRAINIAFIFVPALVGVDEAGTGLVMKTLGFSFEAGVTLAIVRKIRMFCWIAVGLALLLAGRARQRK